MCSVLLAISLGSDLWFLIFSGFLLMFVTRQQRLIENMSGIWLQKHEEEELKGTWWQKEDKAFRKHQLSADEAAMMLGMLLTALLSTGLPFPAQVYIPGAALASRQASHCESDLCREKQCRAKGTWAALGMERSWNPQQFCLLDWLAENSDLTTKSIFSPPSLVFAEVSGLLLCKQSSLLLL